MIKNAQIVGDNVSPAQYDTETNPRGHPDYVIRSHTLGELLRNAQRWVLGYQSPASRSKQYGSLLDCLLLTPSQYPKRFCTTPATYTNKNGELSKWRNDLRISEVAEWHKAHKGLEIVDSDLSASVHAAIARLKQDGLILQLLAGSRHAVMIVAEWHDTVSKRVVPIKALIDIIPHADDPVFSNSLWDLKTTTNASPRSFAMDAQKYNYHLQAAFYQDLWNAATGEIRTDFGHVVQENFHPYEYRTPPPLLSQRFIAFGRQTYQSALALYCKALTTGIWPSYDYRNGPGWPITDCADWFINPDGLYTPIIEDEDDDDDEEVPEVQEVVP